MAKNRSHGGGRQCDRAGGQHNRPKDCQADWPARLGGGGDMKPRRVSTDRDGARALRRLMRPDASPQRLRPAAIPKQSGVTVEIVSEIAAGDYSQHQAKLLTMPGGQLQETGNTVTVRHIGQSGVPAGTRAIVEQ